MAALNPNLAARLAERAAEWPERMALVETRGGRVRRLRFSDLSRAVIDRSRQFSGAGIGPGDRVLLFVPMSAELYATLLAVLHLGAVAVFVDAWAGRRRLDAAVAAARPRAFVGTLRAHLLRLTSAPLRAIPVKLIAGPGGGRSASEGAPGAGAPDLPPATVTGDSPALITFTTGSTGAPKAAARSHDFLWAQHRVLASHLGLTRDDVDLPTLPVFVLNNLAVGATTVLPDFDPRRPARIEPARIFAQIESERVTTTSGSPAFYRALCAWCATRRRKLPVRALFTGGAPVLPPLARLLAETVAGSAHVVYGSTEAEPIASIGARAMLEAMNARDREEGLCAGPPVPEIALRIIRPHEGPIELGVKGWSEWEVASGETGEVVVSGDHVLRGYLDDPAADRQNKIRDVDRVWHRTGDGARLDAGGRLWLMGRVGRRVRRSGAVWWGTPAEVRALEVEGVSHAAYLGVPDEALGQRGVLCVETATGRVDETFAARLRAALAPIPADRIVAFARIPRDPRHESKTDSEALARELERRGIGE